MGVETEDPAGVAVSHKVSTPSMPKQSFLSLLKNASQGGAVTTNTDKDEGKPAEVTDSLKSIAKRKWAVLDDDDFVGGSDDE